MTRVRPGYDKVYFTCPLSHTSKNQCNLWDTYKHLNLAVAYPGVVGEGAMEKLLRCQKYLN